MTRLLWLIPVLPLVATLVNGVLLRGRLGQRAVALVACGSVGLACLLALSVIGAYLAGPEHAAGEPFEQTLYAWIPSSALPGAAGTAGTEPGLAIEMGFLLDPLSAVMLFVVTFVGFWIHVYSVGYMAHEPGFQRYFAYLNLFMGAMLLLVLGNNYLVMFVGWEGVGLCSYLLIGFYYEEEFPPFAGRKAFIVNRIGDFAFIVGLFALLSHFGTLNYRRLFAAVEHDPAALQTPYLLGLSLAAFVGLCLFIGATGKSAQIPLHVWLPDAMAGPTPVSALIHAATMVTAGVYMVARSNALYQLAPGIGDLVAIVGVATALVAGTIGLAQTDIKKVLAYSTVSQLGYMFVAAGVGAYGAAIFHLMTHAFFKALLFLGSGSVIHAVGGEQDMRRMGGLRRHLPTTYWTFVVGAAAISGAPLLSGFFSKDQILAAAFERSALLWAVALATAGLTACYMFRAVFMTFHGAFRGSEEEEQHLHESPPLMRVPLVVLAVGAILAGWVGIPFAPWNLLDRFLSPVVAHLGESTEHHPSLALELALMAASVTVAAGGFLLARRVFGADRGLAGGEACVARFPGLHRLLANKYWIDEAYDATVISGTWGSARGLFAFDSRFIDGVLVDGSRHLTVAISLLSGFFDKYFVDGVVNSVGTALRALSRAFRALQTGLVSQYGLVLALGLAVLLAFTVAMRMGGW